VLVPAVARGGLSFLVSGLVVILFGASASGAGDRGWKSTATVGKAQQSKTASFRVLITGLPRSVGGVVTVTGPRGFRIRLTKTTTRAGLRPGPYAIAATKSSVGSLVYTAAVAPKKLYLSGGKRANVIVAYRRLLPKPAGTSSLPAGGGAGGGSVPAGAAPANTSAGGSSGASSGGGGAGSSASGSSGTSSTGAAVVPPDPVAAPGVISLDTGVLATPLTAGLRCALTAEIPGPPKQIQVVVQDTSSGIRSIATKTTNATVVVEQFTAGTTQAILITATKIEPAGGATLALTITDGAGKQTVCA
jgi:hypothetical protein